MHLLASLAAVSGCLLPLQNCVSWTRRRRPAEDKLDGIIVLTQLQNYMNRIRGRTIAADKHGGTDITANMQS